MSGLFVWPCRHVMRAVRRWSWFLRPQLPRTRHGLVWPFMPGQGESWYWTVMMIASGRRVNFIQPLFFFFSPMFSQICDWVSKLFSDLQKQAILVREPGPRRHRGSHRDTPRLAGGEEPFRVAEPEQGNSRKSAVMKITRDFCLICILSHERMRHVELFFHRTMDCIDWKRDTFIFGSFCTPYVCYYCTHTLITDHLSLFWSQMDSRRTTTTPLRGCWTAWTTWRSQCPSWASSPPKPSPHGSLTRSPPLTGNPTHSSS